MPLRRTTLFLFAAAVITGGMHFPLMAQPVDFNKWPKGLSPKQIGKRVAENWVARRFDFEKNPRRFTVIYPEVCTWYGSLTFAQLSGDKKLGKKLTRKFDLFLKPEWAKHLSSKAHVDDRITGAIPLELFMQTGDRRYLAIGRDFADKQWENPSTDGITAEARYWIDDMYMITLLQVEAYRATQDIRYLDRAALTMEAYLDTLQQPNGLFYHAPDVPFYWGRGNGWVAAGMTELLRSLPKEHPRQPRILKGYLLMMESLLPFQSPDGLWRQLIDRPESWPETSSTGMFAFAMVTGVQNGWLDAARFGPAVRSAWLALAKRIDKRGNISDVCEGTNKRNDYQYYLDRARNTGDLHGQAPVLWTASALLRAAQNLP